MRTWEQNVDNRHLHVMRERGAEDTDSDALDEARTRTVIDTPKHR
ncbi:hypothetical protein OG963_42405 [Streptomyces sp. NBC_01707]|jgi:hypothetical protein|nr:MULTISPECIES: hypothetical protein [unclassified Streptomyces]MDX3767713.1 hypothetical protein [Streptomyces sp. AK08-01B]MDX3820595.1 hypothetical protein [Streptomyces sp. AK08-01A]